MRAGERWMPDRHLRAVDRPDARQRAYLGDGVYAAWDGFGVWLTAENGTATDAIYLEPEVYRALARCSWRSPPGAT